MGKNSKNINNIETGRNLKKNKKKGLLKHDSLSIVSKLDFFKSTSNLNEIKEIKISLWLIKLSESNQVLAVSMENLIGTIFKVKNIIKKTTLITTSRYEPVLLIIFQLSKCVLFGKQRRETYYIHDPVKYGR
ncbi:hypothetical protein H8356DRAFT_1428120 [Neocallimastix lanati (nom. inval.)]|nr:hypothetical protein H8356DRAFT_1428120 [Neocallimastix sp. JGI-2020a]